MWECTEQPEGRVLKFFCLTCENEDLSDVRYIMNVLFEFGEGGSPCPQEEEKGILIQNWMSLKIPLEII